MATSAIAEFLIQNDFTDDSIRTILNLERDISPLSPVIYDRHTLTKLLSIEQSIYQNANLNLSPHGPSHWPAEYAEMMKQASFIISSRIQVVTGLKHIYYDKLDIDTVFVDLGGEYLGLFSIGQNYTPFYVPVDESTQEQKDFFQNRYPSSSGFLGYHYAGGVEYLKTLENPLLREYERVIDFAVVSVLDAFDFTLGSKLTEANVDELTFRHDEFIELRYSSTGSNVGGYGYNLIWETGKLSNQETVNLHNLSRNIVRLNAKSEWESVFNIMDWLVENVGTHFTGIPYFANNENNTASEVERISQLPNDAFFPSAYSFMPKELGGISFSGSQTLPGHLTSALRSLGISTERFSTNLLLQRLGPTWGDFSEEYRGSLSVKTLQKFYDNTDPDLVSYNFGLVLVDNTPWFYEGNFPFAGKNLGINESYNFLIPQEEFTEENLAGLTRENSVDYAYRNTDLKDEYEAVIGN